MRYNQPVTNALQVQGPQGLEGSNWESPEPDAAPPDADLVVDAPWDGDGGVPDAAPPDAAPPDAAPPDAAP